MTNVLAKLTAEIGPELGLASAAQAVVPDMSTTSEAIATLIVAAVAYGIRKVYAWLVSRYRKAQ